MGKNDNLLKRFFLVSDMHYSVEADEIPELSKDKSVNISYAAGDAFGYTQREKIDKITEAVFAEHKTSPLDGVLVLGDLSIDDYSFRNLPYNYCARFKEECMSRLPCPAYAIPGNHDSHPTEVWREIFGYDRQFSVAFGDVAFIMTDSFAAIPANSASGAPYTPTDVDLLARELRAHQGKRIFVCSHYISETKERDEFYRLIRDSRDVVALFRGHTHFPKVINAETLGDKPLIDIGGYAYNGFERPDGSYTFSVFDEAWAWGYQILEVYERSVRIYHRRPALRYVGENGVFDIAEAISDEIVLKL